MLLSINQISELTGQDRRTIVKRLEDLPFRPATRTRAFTHRLMRYRHFAMDSLAAARAAQARSLASINSVREEDLRKQRIPIQIVLDTMDEVFQAIGSTLKAAKGTKLTAKRINELFEKWRDLPAKLKW